MVQLELFPRAIQKDIDKVIEMLEEYPSARRRVKVVSTKVNLSPVEELALARDSSKLETVEFGVDMIADDEIRAIMRYRFIDNYPRKAAVIKWDKFTDRTLDRKIRKGIELMSDALKMYGKI